MLVRFVLHPNPKMWIERYGVSSYTDFKQELEKHCTSFYSQQENMTLSINYRKEKYWKILRTVYFLLYFPEEL